MHRTRGEPAQNKANFPKRGTEAVSAMAAVGTPIFQYSIIPAFQFHADRAKQSQFLPEGPRSKAGAAIVQNKANPSIADWGQTSGGAPNCAKKPIWASMAKPAAERCETNPIPGRGGWDETARGVGRGATLQNEANLPRESVEAKTFRRKEVQRMWIDDWRSAIYHSVRMRRIGTRTMSCMLSAAALSLLGCAEPTKTAATAPVQMICAAGVTRADVVLAAGDVLTGMHFAIEKLDAEQGIVRTRPLRGGQFFELWRSDNAGAYNWDEANLQSVRRAVELRVKPEDRGQTTEDGNTSRLCVECEVSVQRLSLPPNEVAGTSEAYRIHSASLPTLQRIEVTPQQRRAMAWIDLGKDPDLAARILMRVEQRLKRAD